MPTCSYVIFAEEGKKGTLVDSLKQLPRTEVQPADEEDVVLLVSETDGMEEQKDFEDRLDDISSIKMLAQTFGEIVPDAGEVPTDE
ncbi:MAG: hypothetical protein ABEK50_14050 [bacterium]